MKHFRCILLLQFVITASALGQAPFQSTALGPPPNEPRLFVQSLYTEVVARQPIGFPGGPDFKVFEPYFGKALLHRMEVAAACAEDWNRQHPAPPILKPEIGWLELGIFSGDNERASPQTYDIEETQFEKDGSVRVVVRLTRRYPEGDSSIWRVVVVLVRENGHLALDDVVYLKDKELKVEYRLSDALSAGCDGPRWVGYGNKNAKP